MKFKDLDKRISEHIEKRKNRSLSEKIIRFLNTPKETRRLCRSIERCAKELLRFSDTKKEIV